MKMPMKISATNAVRPRVRPPAVISETQSRQPSLSSWPASHVSDAC
jgi:hypothetical protein